MTRTERAYCATEYQQITKMIEIRILPRGDYNKRPRRCKQDPTGKLTMIGRCFTKKALILTILPIRFSNFALILTFTLYKQNYEQQVFFHSHSYGYGSSWLDACFLWRR